ncbi:MAG: hypothetical protein ACTS77_01770 [Arsenophonus sp. NC-TX2-MAG3]
MESEITCDPLHELIRNNLREVIALLLRGELKDVLNTDLSTIMIIAICNGYLLQPIIQTGIGDVEIKVPKPEDNSSKKYISIARFYLLI